MAVIEFVDRDVEAKKVDRKKKETKKDQKDQKEEKKQIHINSLKFIFSMKKTYVVKSLDNSMRLDRWLRSNVENIPQGFLEKCLRNGKIKLNKGKGGLTLRAVKIPGNISIEFRLMMLKRIQ